MKEIKLKPVNVWFVFTVSVLLGTSVAAFGGDGNNGQTDPFDESFVHEIEIRDLDPDVWEGMRKHKRALRRVPQPATIVFDGVYLEDVGVATAFLRREDPNSYLYPNLRVDFDVFAQSDQRLLGLQGFDLKGFVSGDNSLIVERVAYELFAKFGAPTPRTAYARLTVNGEYIGAYIMIESVSDVIARSFTNKQGNLYLLKNTALSAYEDPDAFALAPENPDDPNSYIGDQRSEHKPFEKPVGDPDGYDLVDLIYAFNEATPSTVRLEVSQRLDLDSLIDYLAVDMALSDTDGLISYDPRGGRIYFQNNTFFYHDPTRDKFVLISYNLKGAFDGFDYQSFNRDLMDGWGEFRITRLLLDNADLKKSYCRRVEDFINQFYDPDRDVIPRIDFLRDQIKNDVREDLERPDPPPEGTGRMMVREWLDRIKTLKAYVRARTAFLQRQPCGS